MEPQAWSDTELTIWSQGTKRQGRGNFAFNVAAGLTWKFISHLCHVSRTVLEGQVINSPKYCDFISILVW